MKPAPHMPSHLRFMIAVIQDRAMDLALLGHTGIRAELDIGDNYAVFELTTHPGRLAGEHKNRHRLSADLCCVLGVASHTPREQALTEARAVLADMLDHLDALIDQEVAA